MKVLLLAKRFDIVGIFVREYYYCTGDVVIRGVASGGGKVGNAPLGILEGTMPHRGLL